MSSTATTTPILIVDDDPDVSLAARLALSRSYPGVAAIHAPGELADAVRQLKPTVVLLDMNFTPGRVDGEEGLGALRALMRLDIAPAVIVMTAYADIALAVTAMRLGAFDFITKPWDNDKLVATVAAALASRAPVPGHIAGDLRGESAPMRALRAMIANVGPTDANVLILGENGVGKELVARAVHDASRRAQAVFQAVDLGAIADSTFESELFGHRKGSFTDARSDRAGRFLSANGGTLFLDEIGNLPLAQQAKLLTALERREVTPIGADRAEKIDVRVVSATNLDEARLFDPGHFRADLLYRLNTIVLRVPPLRARRDDIVPLARHFLAHYAQQYGRPARALSRAAADALTAFDWPGNVRALKHACERAAILATGGELHPEDFALPTVGQSVASAQPPTQTLALAAQERAAVERALAQARGNVSEAARLLGISRTALYRRMEKHGL